MSTRDEHYLPDGAPDELLRPNDVERIYGVHASTLKTYRAMTRRSGRQHGPKHVPLSPGVVAYRRSVIEAWIAERETAGQSA